MTREWMAWWRSLETRARVAIASGALLIALALATATWWALHVEEAVLFADLNPQDAALMAAELEKLKIPYSVAAGGTTLLVDKAQVHTTRLKLMGRDLPLHGAVGFELFNNADFGMTEFAQKINYQRALQGELTRTILSFPEVRDVRVHLALPEQGLFRQQTARPTAAITLSLRMGNTLRPEQVSGIQRLVAAAVPGLGPQEVTVVDNEGVALSRVSGEDAAGSFSGRLDLKREMENYLSRKAGAVLERVFGPGQALASVDVTLNMDRIKVTTEDVIGAPDGRGGASMGVLVRERESSRDSATPGIRAQDAQQVRGSSTQRDAEYQAGRRVEHVVSQPGSVRRIHVVAVVRTALSSAQQEQIRNMVAAAVGASTERGDTVLVEAFQPAAANDVRPASAAITRPQQGRPAQPAATEYWAPVALSLFVALLFIVGWLTRKRATAHPQARVALSDEQRQLALRRVEAWLHEESSQVPPATGLIRPQGTAR